MAESLLRVRGGSKKGGAQSKRLQPRAAPMSGPPLERGEVSRSVRVRASSRTLDKFEGLDAAQRGRLIEAAFREGIEF